MGGWIVYCVKPGQGSRQTAQLVGRVGGVGRSQALDSVYMVERVNIERTGLYRRTTDPMGYGLDDEDDDEDDDD